MESLEDLNRVIASYEYDKRLGKLGDYALGRLSAFKTSRDLILKLKKK